MKKDVVILVHGFCRSHLDMSFLDEGLQAGDLEVVSVRLPTLFSSLSQCCDELATQIDSIVKNADSVHYVAHSMGGLIVRAYIDRIQQKNVGRCVFIATPHQGSKLAAIANSIPFYSRIFKPIKDLLPSLSYADFGEEKTFKIGIIAGECNKGLLGKGLMSTQSDGRVEIVSAQATDMDDFIVLPYGHHEIHHMPQTLRLIQRYLSMGRFE